MRDKLSTQEVIDMASKLYDFNDFKRDNIRKLLKLLVDEGWWDAPGDTLERVFDLIVG